ncbi:alpha-2-macroglobulin family protein [Myxococcus stipitatus]|uniref:alpha-2-macroglobulin family protein n=1 Tax=Myxococcus stipitatus TaxID=83455 RepID=UPI0030CE8ACC
MKRTVIVGAVCLVIGFGLAVFLAGGLRRVLGSPAYALAEDDASEQYARLLISPAAQEPSNEEALEGAAPPPPPPPPVVGGFVPKEMKSVADGAPGSGGEDFGKGGTGEEKPAPEGAPSRAWFPETFLFEPLVVTDASGMATLPVRVPDRLTRWRVLALAHSRSGAQAGAVTGFVGTLPTYVDPVLPAFLRAGDVARVPVQVVNTTDAAVEAPLKLDATGVTVEGTLRTVRVPARGSVVEYVTVRASGPGPGAVRAALGDADRVERSLEVWPTGKPVVQTRGGTLAAPRTLSLTGPAEAQPGSERIRLQVYPGGLGVLRSELASAGGRSSSEDVAYALLLAGRMPELLTALGEPAAAAMVTSALSGKAGRLTTSQSPEGLLVDGEAVRVLVAQSTQRALRLSRAPDVASAALLVEGALLHPNNPVLARLGERLAGVVAAAQRPDGTCQGGDGWSLQRLLVATADCAQAVASAGGTPAGFRRSARFTTLAAGALERNRAHVKDGYTAAALLASGLAKGALRDSLRAQVRDALKTREDGSAYLPVETGVVAANGESPSEAEATALAVLGLEGDEKAPLADLGTSLLSRYRPAEGWGGGRANRVALRAVVTLFKAPLPSRVRVVLERDGQVVTEGTYDAQALREVRVLEASAVGSAGAHAWTVRAEPAVPGLGYSLMLSAAVPWKREGPDGGELVIDSPREARVGQPVEVAVRVSTPAGLALELKHSLPVGVQVDPTSLDALVAEGSVSSWTSEDGAVTLKLPRREPGDSFQETFRVIPTLAGTFQTGASWLWGENRLLEISYVPPATWTVR